MTHPTRPRVPRQNPGLRAPYGRSPLPNPQPQAKRAPAARPGPGAGPSRWVVLVLLALLAILLGIAGRMDAEDEQLAADLYCENVKSGTWPDFRGTYAKMCKAKR